MASNAFKVRQFIVLLKNKEGDPIFGINFGKTNPFKMGEAEKNVLN